MRTRRNFVALWVGWVCGAFVALSPAGAQQSGTEPAGVFHGVGVIVAIDAEVPAVTLNHDDIKGLMPGMEMMFRAESKSLLAGFKTGERVNFDIRMPGYVIVGLQRRPN